MVHIAIPEPTSPEHVPDSASYNQRTLPQYLHSLISAGATPIPVPLHETPQRIARILATCHGILLPGSPADIDPESYGQVAEGSEAADPARAAVDQLLMEYAFERQVPMLGICQGLQALNVWRKGSLVQDIPTQVANAANHDPGREVNEAHPIQITGGTRLAAIYQQSHREVHAGDKLGPGALPEYVNSSHHQAIQTVGDGLRVSAVCAQDGVIEAVEAESAAHFVVAVQWHPERTYNQSSLSRAIFHAFVEAAQSQR